MLAGFTTVRDCGAGDKLNLALRDAIAKGWIDGPRVVAAGSVTTTGGHGDGTNGLATELQEALKPVLPGTADGPDAMRAAVRQRYKDGADFIKIAATGGVLSLARSGQAPLFTDDELAAVVQTARDYGMAVAAHAHGAEGMLRAVRAGVRSIEHGTFMTDEVMAAMKERGTYYVPTISAGKFVAEKAKVDGYFPTRGAAQSRGDWSPDPGDVFSRLESRREDRVRHRSGCRAPRRQRVRVHLHGRRRHAADGGDQDVDPRSRAAPRHGEGDRDRRSRKGRRPRCRPWRSADGHHADDARLLRDEGRRGLQEIGALSPPLAASPRRRIARLATPGSSRRARQR